MDAEGDQKGVMDELIASLKTGEAFTRKRGRTIRTAIDDSDAKGLVSIWVIAV